MLSHLTAVELINWCCYTNSLLINNTQMYEKM
jgi:hypothetical protein